VTVAGRIRAFFDELFRDSLVEQLRADLRDAQAERDYFRGENMRLGLLLLPSRNAVASLREKMLNKTVTPEGATKVGGRRSWAQVEHDNTVSVIAELRKKDAEKTPEGAKVNGRETIREQGNAETV
jgi:hypothetical protein